MGQDMPELTPITSAAQKGSTMRRPKGSTDDTPSVAIVVLNWNGLEDTLACITSLLRISYHRCSIIVVDNGSTDGSPDTIASLFPQLPLIRREINGGYAAGNNTGIRYAMERGADFVLVVNNDVVVDPDFLQPMIDQALSKLSPGIVTCKALFQTDTSRVYCTGGRLSKWRCSGKPLPLSKISTVCEVQYVSGCILLVRRDVFETVGFLDEQFFMYGEDLEFSLRAGKLYRMVYTPSGVVYHKSGGGTAWMNYTPTYLYYTTRNRFWIFSNERFQYRSYVFLYNFLNLVAKSIVIVASYGLRIDSRPGVRKRLEALWKGFLHGIMAKKGARRIPS